MKPVGGRGALVIFLSVCCPFAAFQDFVNSLDGRKLSHTAGYNLCADGVASLGYYNGSISVTESGAECLNWEDFPDYIKQYPGKALGDHNHCRTPDGSDRPWCFFRQNSGVISWTHCDCNHGALRLLRSKSTHEGEVELYLNGLWGTICADDWTDWDATVVCRQLGISEIGTAKESSGFGSLISAHLHAANCRGNEKALLHCGYVPAQNKECKYGSIAAVTCSPPEGLTSPIRLVGGKERFEGRVEVFYKGIWGTVCDDHWDAKDAEVVCRQLGFTGKPKALVWAHYGQGSGSILLDEVACLGNESSLDMCPKNEWGHHNCDHIEDAGIMCDPFIDGLVRLSGGSNAAEGLVQIYYQGDWGSVCDDGWTELNAQVVCRQLGFSGPSSLALKGEFGQGEGFIFLDDVVCTGQEHSLLECSHSSWGQHDCSHSEDIGVKCRDDSNDIFISIPPGPAVRLVDGENTKEGRVEVFLNGEWGSVCDDGWTDNDAAVVCRQLGHRGPAKARTMAYFGEGLGPIHLDNVDCSGSENTLAECNKQDSGIHNCWHSEDAGVICDYQEKKITQEKSTGSISTVCGISSLRHRKKRIVGGSKSIRGSWPWQASLRLKGFPKESRLLCGATLISNCWVVTAAHCFKRFGMHVHRYSVRVGDYHTGVEDEYERELPVQKIVIHKNYHPGSIDNDIAVVRVRGKDEHCLAFNYHVLPICLPGKKEKSGQKTCIITGWGDTGTSYSKTLLQGKVSLLPRESCNMQYKGKFTNRMICAGNLSEDNRVDSCQGDSGGPLMCQRSNGQWVIVGITSWGYGCGRKGYPGVYTKVSKYSPWIQKVARLN
uniref:Neurotrypsin n=1 Tax=Leptobrachium leishanense TaxID=445787 RepID=A0A8C5QYB9_9ANUR